MIEYCNSIRPTSRDYCCELLKDHDGKCRAENLDRGGYVFWDKLEKP